tara:strand:- start:1530 stop:1802 length:273 start_codon:yes stop_codon:yes gene_type:complete
LTTKFDIAKKIASDLEITFNDSQMLVNNFINILKYHSKKKIIKINGFGSFAMKKTPSRMGRNPITKEPYLISARTKLKFQATNKLKSTLN